MTAKKKTNQSADPWRERVESAVWSAVADEINEYVSPNKGTWGGHRGGEGTLRWS